jgi:DNA-binding NarL/FixJ family response regulator
VLLLLVDGHQATRPDRDIDINPNVVRRPAAQQERERLQARRLRAAELFTIGVRQAEIARQLGVSRQAVSLWHAAWQTDDT